jgi:hypothetical protein
MSIFSYFRLRAAQQVLCISFSAPVAVFLMLCDARSGTLSGEWFFTWFVMLMVLTWGGLALYTRETDRIRQLADSRMIAVRNNQCGTVYRMKHHEKARLVWEVLQDDEVIRRQLQAWWPGVTRFITRAVFYMPAVLLMLACMVFWLDPDVGKEVITQVRECPPDRLVRSGAGFLIMLYLMTGLAWCMAEIAMNRRPVNHFGEAFLAKVAEYQQRGDETSSPDTDLPTEHAELREGGK